MTKILKFRYISGEGSFAEVIKVKSKVDNKLYAIKRTKYAYRSEAYRSERLEEVKRLEEFSDHPHCVTLYKAWEQNDILYMQLELCKDSLENYASKQRHVPEKMVWSVMLDLLLVSLLDLFHFIVIAPTVIMNNFLGFEKLA